MTGYPVLGHYNRCRCRRRNAGGEYGPTRLWLLLSTLETPAQTIRPRSTSENGLSGLVTLDEGPVSVGAKSTTS